MNYDILKPCPFCGGTDLIRPLDITTIVLRCTNCGATIENRYATILFSKEDLPLELKPHSYSPNNLVIDGKSASESGYIGVEVTASLKYYGVVKDWNKREVRGEK